MVFNSKVVKDLFKKSLTKANKLPREIPNSMKTIYMMDIFKKRKTRIYKPTPEPIKGITGATSIEKP